MYQAKHFSGEQSAPGIKRPAKRRQLRWKKQFAVALSVIVLVLGMVGGSLAWLVASSDEVTNDFIYGKVSCEVSETFDHNTKSNVKIKNTGNTEAYIRAKIVATWQDEAGNIYPQAPELSHAIGEGWKPDLYGFYYCSTAVAPGEFTPVLIESLGNIPAPEEGYSLHVEILADAIQSQPAKAAQEAWGYTPAGA